jgi:hypothetical protein
VQLKFELGELTDYDPTTHTAKFNLPMVTDENDNIQETGFLPLGTMFTGVGFGLQFPPDQGDQALILFLDHNGSTPMAAVFLYNQTETPPFTDGKSWGWLDKLGNFVKTTKDGANAGDGAGGARVLGQAYASVVAPKVELSKEGLTTDQDVVRRKDLQMVVDQVNSFIDIFNSHTHMGVQSGGSSTAPPTSPATDLSPAQASSTVAAND